MTYTGYIRRELEQEKRNQKIVEAFPVLSTNRLNYKLEIPTELEFYYPKSESLLHFQNERLSSQVYWTLELGYRAYDEKDIKRRKGEDFLFGFPTKEVLLMNMNFLSRKYSINNSNEYRERQKEAMRILLQKENSYEEAFFHMLRYFTDENYEVDGQRFSFYQLYAATMKWHNENTWPYDHTFRGRKVHQLSTFDYITEEDRIKISRNISIHCHKQLVGFICEVATEKYLRKITGGKVRKSTENQDKYQNIDFIVGNAKVSVKSGKSLGYKVSTYSTHGKHEYTVGFSDIILESEKSSSVGFPKDKSCDVKIKELVFSNFLAFDRNNNQITKKQFLEEIGG